MNSDIQTEISESFLFLYARLRTERIMVWWCLSVRPSLRVSIRLSVRHNFPHFSPTCILSWNFAYDFAKYCTTDQVLVSSICVIVCRSYHMPLLELRILEIHRYLHFSPTCFDLLSWNLVYDFQFINFRLSSSGINFDSFCRSYWILEIRRILDFSPTCFGFLTWDLVYDFQSKALYK